MSGGILSDLGNRRQSNQIFLVEFFVVHLSPGGLSIIGILEGYYDKLKNTTGSNNRHRRFLFFLPILCWESTVCEKDKKKHDSVQRAKGGLDPTRDTFQGMYRTGSNCV